MIRSEVSKAYFNGESKEGKRGSRKVSRPARKRNVNHLTPGSGGNDERTQNRETVR